MFGFFENADRQISSTRSNFQDFVRGTEVSLGRHQLENGSMCTKWRTLSTILM